MFFSNVCYFIFYDWYLTDLGDGKKKTYDFRSLHCSEKSSIQVVTVPLFVIIQVSLKQEHKFEKKIKSTFKC